MDSKSKMLKPALILLIICIVFSSLTTTSAKKTAKHKLKVGFYHRTCPSAESIVKNVVYNAVSRNPGLAAGLIRLHFHDCFVRGCDASVLLDGIDSEKEGIPNKNSLRGFEVIDAAKAKVEAACPGTVSCADIVAFAARDSAYKVGNIFYDVPSGRRDGRISNINETLEFLPSPFVGVEELFKSFSRKGMSVDEMVTLSGAHSIGIAHCAVFHSRIYPGNGGENLPIDPMFKKALARICPPDALTNGTGIANPTNLDVLSPNRLDNKYFSDLKSRKGVLISDQALTSHPKTAQMVNFNAKHGSVWAKKFAAAMVHMGYLDVLTGNHGEIRRNCHVVN